MVRRGWVVDVVTVAQVNWTDGLIASELPKSGKSFLDRFENFLVANASLRQDVPTLMKGLVGQLRHGNLKWSTITVYLKQAIGYLQKSGAMTISARPQVNQLLKLANYMAADDDIQQAPLVSDAYLKKVIKHASTSEKIWLHMLQVTGARWMDIRRLRAKQIVIDNSTITIEYRVTKVRRKQSNRVVVTIPEEAGLKIPLALKKFVDSCPPNRKPWKDVTTKEVNEAIDLACSMASLTKITTYSFRKRFIARIDGYCALNGQKPEDLEVHQGFLQRPPSSEARKERPLTFLSQKPTKLRRLREDVGCVLS